MDKKNREKHPADFGEKTEYANSVCIYSFYLFIYIIVDNR